jgi:hypothetical protein
VKAISEYVKAQSLSLSQAVVRLDDQYGNGAIVADLAGLSYVMRGKDYDLLDMQGVQTRLTQPPDRASESSAPRERVEPSLTSLISLFRPSGHAHGSSSPHIQQLRPRLAIGITRGKVACLLFYTALPQAAFTPADVVDLASRIGEGLSACEPLKTRSKPQIDGVLIPREARSFGKSWR